MKLCRECAEAGKKFKGLVILSDCKEGCGDFFKATIGPTATTISSPKEPISWVEKENHLLKERIKTLEAQAFEREKHLAKNVAKAFSYGR